MTLAENIKQRALFEGFNKVGIVGAESLEDEGRRLKEWLARGHHGEMSWMARDVHKRISPHEIFPQARSVVVVALNYFTPHQHQQSPATGKVSRYAWGDDYHDVVKEKLLSLLSWIKQQAPHAEGKVCVDIQPTMDKAWAVRAGLGWLGKHSNVITPEHGSWVFIGELLLNLDLEHDNVRIEDHCGTCTLCIDACPTAAITEPYVVDSNKCISYATIELRRRNCRRRWIWPGGCMVVTSARMFARGTGLSSRRLKRVLRRVRGMSMLNLEKIMELTPESYAARYRGSAMKRAKLAGLQRNARALNHVNL